jgi:hypothetical protein
LFGLDDEEEFSSSREGNESNTIAFGDNGVDVTPIEKWN